MDNVVNSIDCIDPSLHGDTRSLSPGAGWRIGVIDDIMEVRSGEGKGIGDLGERDNGETIVFSVGGRGEGNDTRKGALTGRFAVKGVGLAGHEGLGGSRKDNYVPQSSSTRSDTEWRCRKKRNCNQRSQGLRYSPPPQ